MEKIVFLDRDGVINRDIEGGYVTTWAEFDFLPNVFAAISKLKKSGFKIFIISNQAGVGRGLFTAERLSEITAHMLERVKKEGAQIDSVFYCTHRPDDGCACRKPKIGLLKQAMLGRVADLSCAFMVGDSEKDIEAGKAFGVKTILVLSGKARTAEDAANFKTRPDYIANDLLEAVEKFILKTVDSK